MKNLDSWLWQGQGQDHSTALAASRFSPSSWHRLLEPWRDAPSILLPSPVQSPSHSPATTDVPREESGWDPSAQVVMQEILKWERGKTMPEASPCNSPRKLAADYMHTYAFAASGLVIGILFYIQQLCNIQNAQPAVRRSAFTVHLIILNNLISHGSSKFYQSLILIYNIFF